MLSGLVLGFKNVVAIIMSSGVSDCGAVSWLPRPDKVLLNKNTAFPFVGFVFRSFCLDAKPSEAERPA